VAVAAKFVEETGAHIGVPFVSCSWIGRHFAQVKTNDPLSGGSEGVEQVVSLPKGEPPGYRRSGVGGEVGGEAIDVETDIDMIGQFFNNLCAKFFPGDPFKKIAAKVLIGKAVDIVP